MNEEDKQDASVKPAPQPFLRNSFIKYGLLFVIVIGLLVWLGSLAINSLPNSKNKNVVNTVKHLESGGHSCSEGLNKLSSVTPKLNSVGQYSNDARETGLNYVMACTAMTGNSKQALAYGNELATLYKQDGSKSAKKLQQLNDFVTYIKSYRQK